MDRTTVTADARRQTEARQRAAARPKREATRVAPSGRLFWPFDPIEEEISIEDIAHHLSHLCRFTGGTRAFYSVAQHSVVVSQLCLPDFALGALMHDGAEAYLGDVSRPIKHRPEFAALRLAEDRLQELVYRRAGVVMTPTYVLAIKNADTLALHAELRDLVAGSDPSHVEAAKGIREVVPQRPEYARERFLERYHALVKKGAT